MFPVCFPRASFPFLASGSLYFRSPHPLSRFVAISDAPPSFVYLRSMVSWYGLCFPPEGFGSVFPSFPPRFLPLPCVRLSPRWFYCRLLVHRRFDFSPFTFRIPVLPLRLCGSVVVARGFAEAPPHHSPGAAKSTGQAAANKPFVISQYYSGNIGLEMLISTVNYQLRRPLSFFLSAAE